MGAPGTKNNWPMGNRVVGAVCLSLAAFSCVWYLAIDWPRVSWAQAAVLGPVFAGAVVGWIVLPRFLERGSLSLISFVYAGLGGLLSAFAGMPLGGFLLVIVYSIAEREIHFGLFPLYVPLSYLFIPIAVPSGLIASLIAQLVVGLLRADPASNAQTVKQ